MPSKLGVHINFITEADTMRDFILNTRPAIVKTLHHDGVFWQEIKAEYPELLLIGRRYVANQQLSNPTENAEDLARRIRDTSTAHICDAWEGYNEIGPHPTPDYMEFEVRLAELLHAEGIKYVAGSWSVGCPDIPDWDSNRILEVLRVADYIGVHEFCAPSMNDPRGLDADDLNTGWFTLRYRKWYPALPPDCQKPLLITECGIDSGAAHWDPGAQGGWRSFTDAQGYLEQLAWYDGILQQDNYVAGATIYCWGTLDPTWDSYDLSGKMVGVLANYIREQAQPPPTLPDELEELRARIAELEQENAILRKQLTEAETRIQEALRALGG